MCAFCDCKVTTTHCHNDCQYGGFWRAILYTQLAGNLRDFVPEWGVFLPTYSGSSSSGGCLPRSCCWRYVRLSYAVCFLGYYVIMRPVVARVSTSFGPPRGDPKTGLHGFAHTLINRRAHFTYASAPQLQDTRDGFLPGHTLTAYQALYPSCHFPVVGNWQVLPHDPSAVHCAMHLHLWHYLCNIAVYMPLKRLTESCTAHVLCSP